MIDTLRILVSWKCNLRCSYCCNEKAQFRKDIRPVKMEDIDWNQYRNFCISGGEPLLNWQRVREVCARIPMGRLVILYTNGMLFGETIAKECLKLNIQCVNVGLHESISFKRLIQHVQQAARGLPLSVRFHVQDIYADWLTAEFPNVAFRFWKMDDCDRDNEDRVVLI